VGKTEVLSWVSPLKLQVYGGYLRLEGGTADEDGMSSSGSLDRLRPVRPTVPRFAADMLGRSGELKCVSPQSYNERFGLLKTKQLPHLGCYTT